MRDDEIRRVLTEANPWWRAAAVGGDALVAVRGHRLLRDRARYDLGYRSDVLSDLATAPLTDALALLTGPRRVGKSVALLDLAAAVCDRSDIIPFQVIYVPCDAMAARDLRRAFTLGRELTRPADRPGPVPRMWLLDEVSAISGWTAIVKAARDGTDVGDDTVVITGSRWHEGEDVEGNLLAGRAGSTGARRVRHILPMTFRDFLAATRPELALPASVHPADLQTVGAAAALEQLRFDVDAYDLAWQDFLTCGGFPRAVAEHVSAGAVSDDYIRDIAASLRGDARLDGPPESLPLLVDQLAARATSPLNIASTAEALGWTRKVTDGRLNRLVASFAAVWCHQHDDVGHHVAGAQSKLYLTDPLYSWLPSHLRAGLRAPTMTSLTEQTVAITLARVVDELDEGRWLAGDTIGHVRTGSGNEVDLGPHLCRPPAGRARRYRSKRNGSTPAGGAKPESSRTSSNMVSSRPSRSSTSTTRHGRYRHRSSRSCWPERRADQPHRLLLAWSRAEDQVRWCPRQVRRVQEADLAVVFDDGDEVGDAGDGSESGEDAAKELPRDGGSRR